MALNWLLKKEGLNGGGGRVDSWTDTTKHALFRKIEPFQSEDAFLIQIFPRETEFMNNALWSPRGARAGERTHAAGDTLPPARMPRGGQ